MKALKVLFKWIFYFKKMRNERRTEKMMNTMNSFLNERKAKKNIVKKGIIRFVTRKNKIKGLTKHQSHQLATKTFVNDLQNVGLKIDPETLEFKNA